MRTEKHIGGETLRNQHIENIQKGRKLEKQDDRKGENVVKDGRKAMIKNAVKDKEKREKIVVDRSVVRTI